MIRPWNTSRLGKGRVEGLAIIKVSILGMVEAESRSRIICREKKEQENKRLQAPKLESHTFVDI